MSRSKAEKERRYYNKKLLKEGFKSEMKKPIKIDWKEVIANCIGITLGLILTDKIRMERFFHNSFGIFMAETFIIVAVIIVVKVLVYGTYKITSKGN